METVKTFGGKVNRRVESKRQHRVFRVVVDGFGYANDGQNFFILCIGDFHRTVTADRNQRIEPMLFEM